MSESEATLSAAPRAVERPRSGSLWRDFDFNKLWTAQSVSVLGSEVTEIALPLTAIVMLDATAGQVGLLNAGWTLAMFALTLFAGVFVDRLPRRPTLIFCDVGRALVVGAIPLFAFTGHLSMHVLYVSAILLGSLTVVFELALYSYIPSILTGDKLVAANSRLQAVENVGGIMGASLGGFLVSVMRPAFALAADAVSFLVSAAAVALIRRPEPPAASSDWSARAIMRDVYEGFRWTYTHPYLRPLIINAGGTNFLTQVVLVLFILWVVRVLNLEPGSVGIIFAFGAAGGIFGVFVMGVAVRLLGFGWAMLSGMLLFRVVMLLPLVPFMTESDSLRIALLSVVFFVTMTGVTMSRIGPTSLRQYVTPHDMQGRANAAGRVVAFGIVPLGALVGGFLGEAIGVQEAMIVAAAAMPLPVLVVLFSPIPGLKSIEDAPAGNPGPVESH